MRQLLFVFALFSFFSFENTFGQNSGKADITSVKQKEQVIELTITSTQPFYVGGNIHILHIGKTDFSISKQYKEDGKGIITFLIPAADFAKLNAGDDIWLSYGEKLRKDADERKDIKSFCEKSPGTCWSLGKFTKQIQSNEK